MPDPALRADTRLVALQRDEAVHTLAAVRRELTAVLQEHRANELQLADTVRRLEGELMQARDTISHMERSIFWRARQWWVRLRGER
jgi:hypothetical protein